MLGGPYLPIDPADLGRSYEAVIRVNSQSGKGGVAWVIEQDKGLKLPKRLQADLSRRVQALADETSRELNAEDIWDAFQKAYLRKRRRSLHPARLSSRRRVGRSPVRWPRRDRRRGALASPAAATA